jgi:hypothetical protein
MSLAIVVDSELGQHRQINALTATYYDSNFLPPRTALVYASSDKDKNTLQGVLIRACDAVSGNVWEQIMPALANFVDTRPGRDSNYHSALPIRSTLTALPLCAPM